MALPKIDVPIFKVKLISNGKMIRIRPFTVKEEKILLMANEGEDVDTVVDSVKQILSNCIVDDIDVESLPIFDIENLFLNLRARSVGEIVNLRYRCNNMIDGEPDNEGETKHRCDNVVEMEVNVLEIKPTSNEQHEKNIQLSESLGMMMKYPTFSMFQSYADKSEVDAILLMAVSCIDYIYEGEKIHYSKDYTQEELIEFIENLQSKDLDKIKLFFDTMPKIRKEVDFKCGKCGYDEKINIEGIESFFV
jgi:DNA-directed RNA polymerase subunit M/transcription elongation factor TFIIS